MFQHSFNLTDGGKVTVTARPTKCGKGVVVCQKRESADGKSISVSCSGSCGGGPTTYWDCPDGTDCHLDCTSGYPQGSCH